MIHKDDFYIKTESGNKIRPKKIKVLSCYSPSYRLQVKDPELDDGPFDVTAIIRYQVSFELYDDMYADIIQCLDGNGNIEELFYNQHSMELFFEDIYYGDIRPFGDFDKPKDKETD